MDVEIKVSVEHHKDGRSSIVNFYKGEDTIVFHVSRRSARELEAAVRDSTCEAELLAFLLTWMKANSQREDAA